MVALANEKVGGGHCDHYGADSGLLWVIEMPKRERVGGRILLIVVMGYWHLYL